MAFRRTTGIKAYVGARSMTATLLALVISLFAAAAASAHGTRTQRNAHMALSALVARGVVLRPGVGYQQGGSPQVRELQRVLSVTGYPTGPIDGRYGLLTTHAVLGYQSDFGLRIDGIAGPATLASLNGHGELLRRGAGYELGGSPIVRHLQLLLAKAGDSPGPFDGRFGPRTEAAVRRFQAHDGLRVTGSSDRGSCVTYVHTPRANALWAGSMPVPPGTPTGGARPAQSAPRPPPRRRPPRHPRAARRPRPLPHTRRRRLTAPAIRRARSGSDGSWV